MKTVGIIAEYNPFHNGHEYHIEKAKEITGADAVVVIMSGNFVQRGAPAIMPKHIRANDALHCGASLVIELPVCYATGTAEQFAYGAISILSKLGCIDSICFGSECNDIRLLTGLADILVEEPEPYRTSLQTYLRSGMSYPQARQEAIASYTSNQSIASILSCPNNILGIEYLKALKRLNSTIIPYTIQRMDSSYHDRELAKNYSSATAIRAYIESGDWNSIQEHVPCNDFATYKFPITSNDFSLLLRYCLLNHSNETLTAYADVSEELANRIYNQLNNFQSFNQFCELLKTKEITYTRISRALIHVLLNIKKESYQEIEYARVLGFHSEKAKLLTQIKQQHLISIVTKRTNQEQLSRSAQDMLSQDIFAANLYHSVLSQKFNQPFKNEYEHPIIRM